MFPVVQRSEESAVNRGRLKTAQSIKCAPKKLNGWVKYYARLDGDGYTRTHSTRT